jgi:hypothetical protein
MSRPGLLAFLLLLAAISVPTLVHAQEIAEAYPDSSALVPVPLVYDGTGTSLWGTISDAPDSTDFRPADPGLSVWEYPVAGLWWLIKLPFSLLNRGFLALVNWWGDIPFFETIVGWFSRVPEFGLEAGAEWTPSSGFKYGFVLYENRLLNGHLNLQYGYAASGRGDLTNVIASRWHLGESTDLDLLGGYRRHGAERFYGIGPDSHASSESFFTSRTTWTGGSLRHHLNRDYAIEARTFYSEVSDGGPQKAHRFDSTGDVFAGDLPPGWGEDSGGMSYELEFGRDTTGLQGRGARGGSQRVMASYFHPTRGTGNDLMQYRVALEQFVGGHSPSGRQLALKTYWSWLDPGSGELHYQRMLTSHLPDTFRGFHDFRFRDRGIAGFTAEYRYPVWDYGQIGGRLGMDGYVFWDTGQVFDDHSRIRMESLTHSLGIGVRLVTGSSFVFRGELAGSREDFIVRFSLSQVFQRQRGGMYDGRSPIPMR